MKTKIANAKALIGQFTVAPYRDVWNVSLWAELKGGSSDYSVWIGNESNASEYAYRGPLSGYMTANVPAYVKAAIKRELRKSYGHYRNNEGPEIGNCIMHCKTKFSLALRVSPAMYQDDLGNTVTE